MTATDEGYTIKAGFIPPLPYARTWRSQKFNAPFEHKCVGVVLTQKNGSHNSWANIAADNLTNEGFDFYATELEGEKGIYYVAFGY